MDIKEYISSGIIESYALGMLSEAEAAEVEAMAGKHPEVSHAIKEAQQTLEQYATAHSVAPKSEWKDDILSAAFAADESSSSNEPIVKPLPIQQEAKKGPQYLAIAASVALLISLGYNGVQYQSLKEKDKEVTKAQLRVAELESENEVMVANFKNVQENLNVLRDAGNATFVMKAIEGKDPAYRADVHWDPKSTVAYLDVKSLPEAPSGMQYQLWALKDGKPIDMGVFNAGDTQKELKDMGKIPGADAFAVTLEKAGGVPSPTMEQMYVYGEPVAG